MTAEPEPLYGEIWQDGNYVGGVDDVDMTNQTFRPRNIDSRFEMFLYAVDKDCELKTYDENGTVWQLIKITVPQIAWSVKDDLFDRDVRFTRRS